MFHFQGQKVAIMNEEMSSKHPRSMCNEAWGGFKNTGKYFVTY